jgi:hypothetical protein
MATRKKGRPTLLNKVRQGELVNAIQTGLTFKLACTYSGISYNSFRNWMIRGEAEHERRQLARAAAIDLVHAGKKVPKKLVKELRRIPSEIPFLDFFNAITEANAVAAMGWIQVVDSAATNDPNWAMRMLQLRFPKEYGEGKQKVEVSTPDGEPIPMRHSGSVNVEVKPDVERITGILGILIESGAITVAQAGEDDNPPADEVHTDHPDS